MRFSPPVLVACLCLAVAGCVATGPRSPAYTSPLSGYSNASLSAAASSAPIANPKSKSLGLLLSQNTEASVLFMEANKAYAQGFMIPNTTAIRDLDAKHFLKQSIGILKANFGAVRSVKSMRELAQRRLNLGMVLDFQVAIGRVTGEKTIVTIQGIFIDPAGRPVTRIVGTGQYTLGYPAFTSGFKPAADDAVKAFNNKLTAAVSGS